MLQQSGRLLEKTAVLSASVAFEGVALACADSAPMAAKVSELLREASAALEAAKRAEGEAAAAASDAAAAAAAAATAAASPAAVTTGDDSSGGTEQRHRVDADGVAETHSANGGGGVGGGGVNAVEATAQA